uniref:Uncharacterized protein n=1 Tax=Gopherus agassizii TaxID=38772 RepID=A0A452HAP1_9SAUR
MLLYIQILMHPLSPRHPAPPIPHTGTPPPTAPCQFSYLSKSLTLLPPGARLCFRPAVTFSQLFCQQALFHSLLSSVSLERFTGASSSPARVLKPFSLGPSSVTVP